MLRVDRLVKCLTTSGSETSGSGGSFSASASFGSSLSTLSAGTSHVGNLAARRPGLESSKRRVEDLRLRIGQSRSKAWWQNHGWQNHKTREGLAYAFPCFSFPDSASHDSAICVC